jgi:hypothetical protein
MTSTALAIGLRSLFESMRLLGQEVLVSLSTIMYEFVNRVSALDRLIFYYLHGG